MTDRATLYMGDCLEIMRDIPTASVDMVLTDPPYGIKFQSNYRKVKYDRIQNDETLNWIETFISECWRIMKDNTAFYCFCSWHNVDAFKQAIEKKVQS